MAPSKALAELALQKRLLLAESEAQRLILAAELSRWASPVRRVERLESRLRPFLSIGAPVAGFWLTRRSRGLTRWITRGLGVRRLYKTVRHFLGLSDHNSSRAGAS